MEEENFLEKMVGKAMAAGMKELPQCDNCGGTLAGGSLTVNHDNRARIWCMKCVFGAIDYYIEQKEKRLGAGK